ncbi:hypothetical protein BGX24_011117 [Mortierella sp. AD032]|nr:hypothetical protein BGX24_011117 [Mortierella sp. AD032]
MDDAARNLLISINDNRVNSNIAGSVDICHVDIYGDHATNNQFILWDDIKLTFDNAMHVRVWPLFFKERIRLNPLRIAAKQGEVLDIVVCDTVAIAAAYAIIAATTTTTTTSTTKRDPA